MSLVALIGGDARVVDAHDRAVARALDWFERNAAETRVQDRYRADGPGRRPEGRDRHVPARASRNLDPALHTHSVIANMLLGADGKWRTMANERLYASKMLLGALYRSELAAIWRGSDTGSRRPTRTGASKSGRLARDCRGVSSRRAEIEAAMESRGHGATAENQHLARRAALMTRAHKRDVDREALRGIWTKQAAGLGLDAKALAASAMERAFQGPEKEGAREAGVARQVDLIERPSRPDPAKEAVGWALAHLSERDAVFAGRTCSPQRSPTARRRVHRSRRTGRPRSHARGPFARCAGTQGR